MELTTQEIQNIIAVIQAYKGFNLKEAKFFLDLLDKLKKAVEKT